MANDGLEICRLCQVVVPVESHIFQIYDNACVKFLEEIKEISGVDLNGIFEQPWYICMNCYSALWTAQFFRKRCIEAYELYKNNKIAADITITEDILKEAVDNTINVVENDANLINEKEFQKADIEVSNENTKKNIQKDEKVLEILRLCEICGNVFEKKRNFKLHMHRHTNNKRFECELCLNKFYTTSELKCHMRKHTGEKPYECKYCHRKFSDYGTHKNHERTHTNERPFCCNFCEKSFTNLFMLKNHILIHKGARNYKCTICKRDFVYPGHLTSHLKSSFHLRNCKMAEEEKEAQT